MKVETRLVPVDDAASRARGDELVAWLRDWCERRLNSQLIDERRSIPPHVALDLGRRGLFGLQVEEKYGGLGLRNREVARVLAQAAAVDLGLGTWLLTSLFPGVRPIAAFGSAGLKDEVLPDLAAGRLLAGYAQTEPGAGTHFPAMAARAVAAGDGWRVSGDKVWIGNSTWAGVLTVMAHELEPDGRRRGITAFAVRTDRPGVHFGREILSMGMRGMVQGEISFRDVAVGPDDVVGEPRRGLDVGVDSMSFSRFAIAATCLGAMKRAARLMMRFAGRRTVATGSLAAHPVVRAGASEALVGIAALEGLLAHVAAELDAGRGVAAELFAAAKVLGSEALWTTVDRLVQTLGSRGYDEANGVAQLLRDARVTRIFEGATEPLVAFVGALAMTRGSELDPWLRDAMGAPDAAAALADAVDALRRRPVPEGVAARPWQCALAGDAAMAAIAVAGLGEGQGLPAGVREPVRVLARRRLLEACERAATGGALEPALLDPAALTEAVEALAEDVGDVELTLPGERLELDPLLRRRLPEPGA